MTHGKDDKDEEVIDLSKEIGSNYVSWYTIYMQEDIDLDILLMPLAEQASFLPSINLHLQSPFLSLQLAAQIPSPSPQIEPILALIQIPQKSNKSNNSKRQLYHKFYAFQSLKFQNPKRKLVLQILMED